MSTNEQGGSQYACDDLLLSVIIATITLPLYSDGDNKTS